MKIALNTRFLIKNKLEGIGMYTHEIVRRIVQSMPEHQFYLLFDRIHDASFIYAENCTPIEIFPPARHPFLWYWWFEKSIPRYLKQHSIDVFFSPDGFCSLSTDVPQLLTIHDLGFEHYPQHTPFLVQQYYRHFTPKFCQKAAQILSVSEFTKQDIVQQYSIKPEKIEVIYNGFDTTWMHEKSEPIPSAYLKTLNQRPYFIFVGAIHPRKNVLQILKSFEQFKATTTYTHQLVLIGRDAWMNKELNNYIAQMHAKNDVIRIDAIDRISLLHIFKNATALVYPSWFEGFGIPLIEAMNLGVPIITSNVSAMPEIAANAALYAQPSNTDELCNALKSITEDTVLRNTLIKNGKENATRFNWDVSTEKVVHLLQQYQR